MLAAIGQIIIGLALAAIPAAVAGYAAMWFSEKMNPNDTAGQALAFVLAAIPTFIASVAAILWWGL